MWSNFRGGFSGLALAFEWWRALLSTPRSSDWLCEYADFWEELGSGWMEQYIWPYDGWYSPTASAERKLRLGAR